MILIFGSYTQSDLFRTPKYHIPLHIRQLKVKYALLKNSCLWILLLPEYLPLTEYLQTFVGPWDAHQSKITHTNVTKTNLQLEAMTKIEFFNTS